MTRSIREGCLAVPLCDLAATATLRPDLVVGSTCRGDPVGVSDVGQGDVVVDLGSESVTDLIAAVRKVGSTGCVVGIGDVPALIAPTRRLLLTHQVFDAQVLLAPMERVPLPEGFADWVVSNCAIHRSGHKTAVFSEIARILKPGGEMRIADVFVHNIDDSGAGGVLAGTCLARATDEAEYVTGLSKVGLIAIAVGGRYVFSRPELTSMVSVPCGEESRRGATDLSAAIVGGVWRAYIYAQKPRGQDAAWHRGSDRRKGHDQHTSTY